MSRYRMCFLDNIQTPLVTNDPPIGIYGDTEQDAVAMSRRIWDILAAGETTQGYTLLDTHTGHTCYTRTR